MSTYENDEMLKDSIYRMITYIVKSNGRDYMSENKKLLTEMICGLKPESIEEVIKVTSRKGVTLDIKTVEEIAMLQNNPNLIDNVRRSISNFPELYRGLTTQHPEEKIKEFLSEKIQKGVIHHAVRGDFDDRADVKRPEELKNGIKSSKEMGEYLKKLNSPELTKEEFKRIVENGIGESGYLLGDGMFLTANMWNDRINRKLDKQNNRYIENYGETKYPKEYVEKQRNINDFLQTVGEGGYSDDQLKKMIRYTQELYPANLMNIPALARGLSPKAKEEFLIDMQKRPETFLMPPAVGMILTEGYTNKYLEMQEPKKSTPKVNSIPEEISMSKVNAIPEEISRPEKNVISPTQKERNNGPIELIKKGLVKAGVLKDKIANSRIPSQEQENVKSSNLKGKDR